MTESNISVAKLEPPSMEQIEYLSDSNWIPRVICKLKALSGYMHSKSGGRIKAGANSMQYEKYERHIIVSLFEELEDTCNVSLKSIVPRRERRADLGAMCRAVIQSLKANSVLKKSFEGLIDSHINEIGIFMGTPPVIEECDAVQERSVFDEFNAMVRKQPDGNDGKVGR